MERNWCSACIHIGHLLEEVWQKDKQTWITRYRHAHTSQDSKKCKYTSDLSCARFFLSGVDAVPSLFHLTSYTWWIYQTPLFFCMHHWKTGRSLGMRLEPYLYLDASFLLLCMHTNNAWVYQARLLTQPVLTHSAESRLGTEFLATVTQHKSSIEHIPRALCIDV